MADDVTYTVHLIATVVGDDVEWQEVADGCVREFAGSSLDVRGGAFVVDEVSIDRPEGWKEGSSE